jgi:hypothetical protein
MDPATIDTITESVMQNFGCQATGIKLASLWNGKSKQITINQKLSDLSVYIDKVHAGTDIDDLGHKLEFENMKRSISTIQGLVSAL